MLLERQNKIQLNLHPELLHMGSPYIYMYIHKGKNLQVFTTPITSYPQVGQD